MEQEEGEVLEEEDEKENKEVCMCLCVGVLWEKEEDGEEQKGGEKYRYKNKGLR